MSYFVLCEKASIYPKVEEINICSIYKEVPKILRIVRYFHHRLNIFPLLKKYWLGAWRNEVDCDSRVIIFDSLFDEYPLDYLIEKKVKSMDFCFRNKICDVIRHGRMDRTPTNIQSRFGCGVWSYNEEDCAEFGMNYYSQFHIIPDVDINKEIVPKYDLFFVGKDKGRLSRLKELSDIASNMGINCLFKVIPDSASYQPEDNKFLSPPIPYEEVLELIKQSKCVVDIVSEQNRGMTFRSLEASIFKKKLITNYDGIVSLDFYHPNNIFIIGQNDINKLSEFINTPYKQVLDVYSEYSFGNFCSKVWNIDKKVQI